EKKVLELIVTGAAISEVLDTLMRETEAQSTDGMLCSVLLADETGQCLLHGAAPSLPPAYNTTIHGIVIGPSAGSCGTAAFERKPVFVTDIAADPRWADFKDVAAVHGLGACHSTPILSSQGRLLGTIAMYYRRPHNPGARDRHLIERATQLAGIVIERKQVEEALRESQDRFQAIMDNSPALIFLKDVEGRYLLINRRFEEAFHLVNRDVIGKTDEDILPQAEAAAFRANDRKVLKGGTPMEFEESALHDDGPHTNIVMKFPLLNAQGQCYALCGIATDITERKRRTEALRLAKFSMDRAADAVYWIDPQAKVLDVNEAASRMLGYSKHELCAMTVHDLNPDFQADMWPGFWAETQRRGTMVLETCHKAKNGRLIPIEVSVNFLSYEGKEYHCAFVRDITERRRMEEMRARLAAIVEGSDDAIIGRDLDGIITSWNQGAQRLLGYTEQEAIGRPVSILIPSDREDEQPYILDQIKRGEPIQQYETVRRRKDGSVIDVSLTVSPIKDATGRVIGASKIARDITEHKQTEEALRRSEAFVTSMVENLPNMIFVKDAKDLTFVRLNKAGEDLLGHSREALMGKSDYDFFPKEEADFFTQKDRQVLQTGGLMDIPEEVIETKHQGLRILHTKKIPIYDDIGKPRYLLGISEDITERKRTEDALKKSEDRYRSIFEKAVEGIFQTTLDGTYVAVNPALARIYGYDSPADLIATITDIASQLYVDPERRDEFLRLMQAQEEVTGFEALVYRKDGAFMWISESARTLRDRAGTVIGYEGTVEDITERKRAEGRLRVTLDQVRALSGRLATVQEEERFRIARELHDELGVKLTCLKIDLSRVMSLVENSVRPALRDKLNDRVRSMVEQVDSTIAAVQRLVSQLRPALLDNLGLVAAIEWQSQDFQKRTGISCTCVSNADDIAMEPERATAALRICQEALTNTARHAQATAVMITVTSQPDSLQMTVTDNGVGIPDTRASDRRSFGLLGMQERAAQCGGTVTIEGDPEKGTTVTLCLPVG
ncbi:MAG TPA: PAS domain S-box protein, partial [Nitrospira sp.]